MIERRSRASAHEFLHPDPYRWDAKIVVKVRNEAIRHYEVLLSGCDLKPCSKVTHQRPPDWIRALDVPVLETEGWTMAAAGFQSNEAQVQSIIILRYLHVFCK